MYRVNCRECLGTLEPMDWLPEDGLDPHLRKFKCSRCHKEEYQSLTEDEQKRFKVKLLELAERR